MKYENIEQAQKALAELERNLSEFEDEAYNLNEEINKGKAEIKSIENLCDDLKASNYTLWSQSTIMQNEVQEIEEESQPTINDLINGGIL